MKNGVGDGVSHKSFSIDYYSLHNVFVIVFSRELGLQTAKGGTGRQRSSDSAGVVERPKEI
jgi:hypothetical protein